MRLGTCPAVANPWFGPVAIEAAKTGGDLRASIIVFTNFIIPRWQVPEGADQADTLPQLIALQVRSGLRSATPGREMMGW